MRPLTLATPKPLLKVGDYSLLEHLIKKLRAAGVTEFVMNVSYLADQILNALRSMDLMGSQCHVSVEQNPLETGGGLVRALPYLGDKPFLLVNADVWSEINFESLMSIKLPESVLAHLILVESPEHNHAGDFVIEKSNRVRRKSDADLAQNCLTFSGISIVDPMLIKRYADEREVFPMRDLLYAAIEDSAVSGEYFPGFWSDVGTPERLDSVRIRYAAIG